MEKPQAWSVEKKNKENSEKQSGGESSRRKDEVVAPLISVLS